MFAKNVLFAASVLMLFAGCGMGGDPEAVQTLNEALPSSVYHAANAGDLEGVKKYIEANDWDPQSPDAGGLTPLNRAVEGGNPEIVRLMVENGADVNQIDVKGDTPLKLAEKRGKEEIVKLLKELGAT